MTSTSVKDLGGLMNYVNSTGQSAGKTKGFQTTPDFGNAMMKASEGQTQTSNDKVNAKMPKTDETAKEKFAERPETNSIQKPKETDQAVEEEVKLSDEELSQIEEAGEKIMEAVADEMEVSVEDVEEAMEILGLSVISLLEPSNLNQLVLELSDETEPIALVTNENLFDAITNLTAIVDATTADLAQDMDIEVSNAKELIELAEVQTGNFETEMSVEADSDADTIKEAPRFTVQVEDRTVETDENGNEIKTITVDNNTKADGYETKNQDSDLGENKSKDDNHHESQLDLRPEMGIKNPVLNNLVNEVSETTSPEAPMRFVSEQTQDIMNQIMDRMKIDLKPETEEIEMQLHPSSLGSVKVNLTANKAGEVTAEFKVQNELVKAAVESQLNDLRETFKASGTRVTQIEVSVELQSFDSNLWQGKGHDSEAQSRNSSERRTRRINLNELDALFKDEATEEEKLAAEMMEANGNTVDFTA